MFTDLFVLNVILIIKALLLVPDIKCNIQEY